MTNTAKLRRSVTAIMRFSFFLFLSFFQKCIAPPPREEEDEEEEEREERKVPPIAASLTASLKVG